MAIAVQSWNAAGSPARCLFQPWVGAVGEVGFADGARTEARFSNPGAVALDRTGNLYVADSLNHCIRKISPDGRTTTVAGLAVDNDFDGINEGGYQDGAASVARFNYPAGLAVDNEGCIFVADAWNHAIRRISPAGLVTTLAGQPGNYGHRDGPALTALFDDPSGIAVNDQGTLFVAERGSHIIRRISPDGFVTTLAGSPAERGAADGPGDYARFDRPGGLCLDAAGHLWVADSGNHTIRRVTPDGIVTTVAGIPGIFGHVDGEATSALLFEPRGVAVDKQGIVYVADTYNNAIRRLTPEGQLETLWPVRLDPPIGDGEVGQESSPQFSGPSGLLLNESGGITVADAGNNVIQTGVEVARVDLGITFEGGVPVLHVGGGCGRSCTIEARSGPDAAWTPLMSLHLTADMVSVPDHTAGGVPFRLYRVRP